VRRADNLATFICRLTRNSGSLNLLEFSGPVRDFTGIALPYLLLHSAVRLHTNRLHYTPTGYITHQQATLYTNRLHYTPTGYIIHQQATLHTNRLHYTPTGYITHQQATLHTNRLHYTYHWQIFLFIFLIQFIRKNRDFSAGTLQSVWLPASGHTVSGSKAGRGENFCTRADRSRPSQPLVQSVPGLYSWGKTTGAWRLSPTLF